MVGLLRIGAGSAGVHNRFAVEHSATVAGQYSAVFLVAACVGYKVVNQRMAVSVLAR